METGMEIDQAWFRQVLGHFPTGVVIVTAMSGDKPAGLSVGSFLSVSLDPQLVAVLPAKTSTSWPKIAAASSFCINVLHASHQDLSRKFAVSGGDKFAGGRFEPSRRYGLPLLPDALAVVGCAVHARHDGGDHDIYLGQVYSCRVRDGAPMLHFDSRFWALADGAAA